MNRYEDPQAFIRAHRLDKIPTDIVAICEKLGFKVLESYLLNDTFGYVAVGKQVAEKFGSEKVIVVNLKYPPSKRRFAIAHELAYYRFASGTDPDENFAHRYTSMPDEDEVRVDGWARKILMPDLLVKNEFTRLANVPGGLPARMIVSKIADIFLVTTICAETRLRDLSLIRGIVL